MTGSSAARRVALLSFVVTFVVLVANGRAIGSGDTNAVEKTAAALAQRGSFVLLDGEPLDPFTRATPGGRISIYPPLTALVAAPFFWLFGLFFDLNLNGVQVAGKLVAALLSSTATSIMCLAFARRVPAGLAFVSALIFGLGTSVYSTAQALWQHPAVLVFLAIAMVALDRVESALPPNRFRPAFVAALSLSLAAGARPACIPMCAALFVFLLARCRGDAQKLLIVACLPALAVASYNSTYFGAPWRFGQGVSGRFFAAFPESVAGLLISPARGLLIFTPVALVALWSLARSARTSALARALLVATVVHLGFISAWNEWHGGESFGPRLLTDLLPPLFFFLPEGLMAWPKLGSLAAVLSISAQLVGGWTYDYRWERLHQRGQVFDAALWSWPESPIIFALREGVVIQGTPDLDGRRIRLPAKRFVPFGPRGSSIEAVGSRVTVTGAPQLSNIRLERGAHAADGRLVLTHPADALAFRFEPGSADSIHIRGSLLGTPQGAVVVETRRGARRTTISGDFDVSVPIDTIAGDDIFIRTQSGELRLLNVTLQKAGVSS